MGFLSRFSTPSLFLFLGFLLTTLIGVAKNSFGYEPRHASGAGS